MASPMLRFIFDSFSSVKTKYFPSLTVIRHTSQIPYKKPKQGTIKHRNIIKSCCESLAARGFLRSQKPYTPSENVTEKITQICEKLFGANYKPDSILSREDKFALLNACFEEIKYGVPNSRLNKINTVDEVIQFYQTPVSTVVPFDEFKNQELPPNLHIQYDYIRFNPNTDTRFKGISAFPRSSTIVTGLKYKGKYKGYKAKTPYLDFEAHFEKKNPFD